MNGEEAVKLVAYLNRAGLVWAMEGQGGVWADALHDVAYPDAQAACRELVREGTASGRPATPADVRRVVKRVRAARIGGRVPPAPPNALDTAGELAFGRAYLRALGDGATDEQADAVACRAVGQERPAAIAAGGSGRLRELMQGVFAGKD